MTYEFHKKGDVLFHEGDLADRLFIILRGTVSVLVPRDEQEYARDKETHYKIHEEEIQGLESAKQPLGPYMEIWRNLLELRGAGKIVQQQRKIPWNGVLRELDAHMEVYGTELRLRRAVEALYKEDPRFSNQLGGMPFGFFTGDFDTYFDDFIFRYIYKGILSVGDMFGELGLLRNSARTSTIICKEDTHFGIISKHDYNIILKAVHHEKFAQKLQFFHDNLINGASHDMILMISYAFKKERFFFKNRVLRQGEPVDGFFLITNGIIQVFSCLSTHLI
jgi:CRP-like cAMP-binding protein